MTTAATVNVTATTTNPPPAGECFANGGTYTCTISLKLPVGILICTCLRTRVKTERASYFGRSCHRSSQRERDGYAAGKHDADYDCAHAKGRDCWNCDAGRDRRDCSERYRKAERRCTELSNEFRAIRVLGGWNCCRYKSKQHTNTSRDTDPIVTITDSESGGALPRLHSERLDDGDSVSVCDIRIVSVTLSTSGDSYAVLFNGKFAPAGALTISASFVGASPTPAPITVAITPTIFWLGPVTLGSGYSGPIGAVVYDSVGKNAYVGMGNSGTPLYKIAYSSSTGYATPSAVNVTSVNGSAATNLSGVGGGDVTGGPNAMVVGPDNNIWMIENNSRPGGAAYPQYVAVAAINSSVINPTNGATISPGPGIFAEYTVQSTAGINGNYSPPLHGIASMAGFIWIMGKDGMIWRINPSTGLVSPNLAAGYLPSQSVTQSSPITDPGDTTLIYGSPGSRQGTFYSFFTGIGSDLYLGNDSSSNSVAVLTVDTSASPSAGICTTPGPPPCIATFQSVGSVSNTYLGGGTDGTSLYLMNGSSGSVYKFTPPSTVATSQSVYTDYDGTVGVSPDGWLWTLASTGTQALKGITSTAAPVVPATVSACTSVEAVRRGANAWMTGPDGTWLFTPNDSDNSSTSFAVLCAVVY